MRGQIQAPSALCPETFPLVPIQQSWAESGYFGEQDKFFSLVGIETHILGSPALNLSLPTTLLRLDAYSERDFRGISSPEGVSPTYSRNAQGHAALFRYYCMTPLIALGEPCII